LLSFQCVFLRYARKIIKKNTKKAIYQAQNGFVPIYFDFKIFNILIFKCLRKIVFLICPCFFGLRNHQNAVLLLFESKKMAALAKYGHLE